ncbi:unnamed protein product [Soboliphyme baturini]|uniref:Uncharacterized protein n=1 Tax=Soboliphyme baturini TaxID=241478 RepID=A0A183J7R4_9BILA|nr:unnamed protein product [Soboliphyme baturini]
MASPNGYEKCPTTVGTLRLARVTGSRGKCGQRNGQQNLREGNGTLCVDVPANILSHALVTAVHLISVYSTWATVRAHGLEPPAPFSTHRNQWLKLVKAYGTAASTMTSLSLVQQMKGKHQLPPRPLIKVVRKATIILIKRSRLCGKQAVCHADTINAS